MRSTASRTCSDRTTRPTHDHQVRSELRSGPTFRRVGLCVVAAPRVGLEPTTLRLTVNRGIQATIVPLMFVSAGYRGIRAMIVPYNSMTKT